MAAKEVRVRPQLTAPKHAAAALVLNVRQWMECIGMAREIYIKKVAVNGEGIGQCPWFHVPRLHQLKLPCIYAVACTE